MAMGRLTKLMLRCTVIHYPVSGGAKGLLEWVGGTHAMQIDKIKGKSQIAVCLFFFVS